MSVASQTALIPSREHSCQLGNSVLCLFVVLELNLPIFPSDLLFNSFPSWCPCVQISLVSNSTADLSLKAFFLIVLPSILLL